MHNIILSLMCHGGEFILIRILKYSLTYPCKILRSLAVFFFARAYKCSLLQ